jgi:hypothetical protein
MKMEKWQENCVKNSLTMIVCAVKLIHLAVFGEELNEEEE